MTLRDFRDFDADPLTLPINGKRYAVPPVTAQDGLYLSVLGEKVKTLTKESGRDVDLVAFTDEGEEDLYKRSLGALYDELVEDNVPLAALRLAGMVAFADFALGRDHAEALWELIGGGAAGEAPSPNRAQRRAASKTPSAKTGAAANTTKKRASGSGTKSRPTSSPTGKPSSKD